MSQAPNDASTEVAQQKQNQSQSLPTQPTTPTLPNPTPNPNSTKLKEDNKKLKNLVKLAKARIEESDKTVQSLTARIKELETAANDSANRNNDFDDENYYDYRFPIRAVQRVQVETDIDAFSHSNSNSRPDPTLWVLFEYLLPPEATPNSNSSSPTPTPTPTPTQTQTQTTQRWKKFQSESQIMDFVRMEDGSNNNNNGFGDSLHLPHYSLSPAQSSQIESESRAAVSHLTEEFRRYRVRNEISKKQSEMAFKRVEESKDDRDRENLFNREDVKGELEQGKRDAKKVQELKAEIGEQEQQWKEAYDTLLKNNELLKGNRAESVLASQWRMRYEVILKEKEDICAKLEYSIREGERGGGGGGGKKRSGGRRSGNNINNNENMAKKYQDLRDEYRLYRKKAKEIFDEMKGGEGRGGEGGSKSGEDRLVYLKNIMVQYLSSEVEKKERMESAIGMALNFSASDLANIDKRKREILANASWL